MSEITHVKEDKPDHHWRTEIPNIIWDLGMKSGYRDLYSYYKKVAGDNGHCSTSAATIQKATGISPNTQKKYRDGLSIPHELLGGKSLIRVYEDRVTPEGDPDTVRVEIVNIWRENGDNERRKIKERAEERFKGTSKFEGGTSKFEGGVPQNLREGTSKFADKEEPLKKILKKNNNKPSAIAAQAVVVFSILNDLGIPEEQKIRISSEHDEEKVKLLVKRVKAWKGKGSDSIACNTILKNWDTWGDNTPPEDRSKENKDWAQKNLKPLYVTPKSNRIDYVCEVLNNHVEFLPKGSPTQPTCFSYEKSDFLVQVKDFLNKNGIII